MENNKSYKITPCAIVEDGIRFRIPLYQRLFTWETKEVNQLLEDLRLHFTKRPDKPYYVGMITVVRQGDRLDLIDGQQRITVLTLLSIGFMLCGTKFSDGQKWDKFFDDSNRVFFNGRSQDREYLKSLASEAPSSYKNTNMADGLSAICSYLKSYFEDEKQFIEFSNKVYDKLTLFVTELPNHYVENPSSLNEYFEAMNSSGKSLEQHEILKVDLLKEQADEDKVTFSRLWNAISNFESPLIKTSEDINQTDQVDRYLRYLSQCRNGNFDSTINDFGSNSRGEGKTTLIAEIKAEKKDFGGQDYRDREDAIVSVPEFLLMVLAIHLNDDKIARVHPSKLHKTFEDNPLKDVRLFYQQLIFYRLLMDLYVVRVKYSSSSGHHKLIFRERDNQNHVHERLKQFESMFDVSTEPHRWVLPLLKFLATKEPTQADMLSYLMDLDNKLNHKGVCPDVIHLDYDSKPRYWLWRLDYAIWEKLILVGKESLGFDNLDSEAIRQYEFRRNRSIEHLHPQDESNNDKWTRQEIDAFGNLAMISQSFNSSQSNLSVHVKFANLEVQINNRNLQSIKLYLMYLKAKCSDQEWTTEAMQSHSEEMMKILKESIENQ